MEEWLRGMFSLVSWRVSTARREAARLRTTTSIIMLPLAPAKPLPPKLYTSCAMIVLGQNSNRKHNTSEKNPTLQNMDFHAEKKHSRNKKHAHACTAKARKDTRGREYDHAVAHPVEDVQ